MFSIKADFQLIIAILTAKTKKNKPFLPSENRYIDEI